MDRFLHGLRIYAWGIPDPGGFDWILNIARAVLWGGFLSFQSTMFLTRNGWLAVRIVPSVILAWFGVAWIVYLTTRPSSNKGADDE